MCEKRLRRSSCHYVLGGVCGGIAEYFNTSPALIRLLYILLSVGSIAFPGILVYLVLWIVIPKRYCMCGCHC